MSLRKCPPTGWSAWLRSGPQASQEDRGKGNLVCETLHSTPKVKNMLFLWRRIIVHMLGEPRLPRVLSVSAALIMLTA